MFLRRFVFVILVSSWALSGCDQSPMIIDSAAHSGNDSSLCSQAIEHVQACTGSSTNVLGDSCNADDAEMLMETPCVVMQEAQGVHFVQKADSGGNVPFTCKWFGIGCPVDDSCAPTLSDESVDILITLSDPTTLVDEYDARDRIESIATIFEIERDPIGMFAIVYRHITNNAVASVEDGMYNDPVWTRKLITAFARRYLVNLHGHLTGAKVTAQWKKYYKLARNCDVGRGRVLGVAIATHLLVDLTYALHDVESVAAQEEDYMLFGEVSLWVFPDLVADTKTVYGTDVSALLKGFFFGDWVDSAAGEGASTTFIYQTVRRNAWRNSQNLWSFPHWMVHADVRTGWGMAELSLAVLDATGAL